MAAQSHYDCDGCFPRNKIAKKLFSYVVFDVRLAAGQQEDSAGLIVAVLAAEVEGGEPPAVLDVGVCLGFAQHLGEEKRKKC